MTLAMTIVTIVLYMNTMSGRNFKIGNFGDL